MKETKEAEEAYKKLEDTLEELEPEVVDIISAFNCSECGDRLTTEEHKEFEDVCENCIRAYTAVLIDDDEYLELDFDDEAS